MAEIVAIIQALASCFSIKCHFTNIRLCQAPCGLHEPIAQVINQFPIRDFLEVNQSTLNRIVESRLQVVGQGAFSIIRLKELS